MYYHKRRSVIVEKKVKNYDLNGTEINLYEVVELKKEYEEERNPLYGYYGVLVITLDNGDLIKTTRIRIGGKELSLDDAYRNVDNKINEIKRLIEKLN